jgi:hypothetical protein
MNIEMHKELCSRIAQRVIKDIATYGPQIAPGIIKILMQIFKTLGH